MPTRLSLYPSADESVATPTLVSVRLDAPDAYVTIHDFADNETGFQVVATPHNANGPFVSALVNPIPGIDRSAVRTISGLTPGSIGLYQIDVQVPQNAPTGLQPVLIMQNDVSSQPANLPVQ